MLAKARPFVQLVFFGGATALAILFGMQAVEGQRREARSAIEALRPAYEGNDRLAPDFTLRDRHGRSFRFSSLRGKVVVLNFWTITCGPCVEELPSLEELAHIVSEDDDVAIVSVSVDAGWAEVRRLFAPESRLLVLFDPERKVVHDKYGTTLFPETWIIDREGIIRARFDGARDWSGGVELDYIRSLT